MDLIGPVLSFRRPYSGLGFIWTSLLPGRASTDYIKLDSLIKKINNIKNYINILKKIIALGYGRKILKFEN